MDFFHLLREREKEKRLKEQLRKKLETNVDGALGCRNRAEVNQFQHLKDKEKSISQKAFSSAQDSTSPPDNTPTQRKYTGSVVNQQDEVYLLTQSFDSTFVWLMQNHMLNLIPTCQKCLIPLKLVLAKVTENFDSRWYKCSVCKIKEGIRFGSFTAEFKCTVMEIVRIVFYYYTRGYTVDVVFRELSFYNLGSKGGLRLAK
jgi:hypothetical protein